jgi:hypothetical protein
MLGRYELRGKNAKDLNMVPLPHPTHHSTAWDCEKPTFMEGGRTSFARIQKSLDYIPFSDE